jgi:hypothetical protein
LKIDLQSYIFARLRRAARVNYDRIYDYSSDKCLLVRGVAPVAVVSDVCF